MIERCPDEIVEYISDYLDPNSVMRLQSTCKHTYKIKFGRYWRKIFRETFPKKDPVIYSITSMKSLICTRLTLKDLQIEVVELKRYVDLGAYCDFINAISLNLSLQAVIAPFSILFLAPITILQVRDFYENKRNTEHRAAL